MDNTNHHDRIERDFTYHAPTDDAIRNMQDMRIMARQLAHLIDSTVPESREKALALTNLEQVVMWANSGIVRN